MLQGNGFMFYSFYAEIRLYNISPVLMAQTRVAGATVYFLCFQVNIIHVGAVRWNSNVSWHLTNHLYMSCKSERLSHGQNLKL